MTDRGWMAAYAESIAASREYPVPPEHAEDYLRATRSPGLFVALSIGASPEARRLLDAMLAGASCDADAPWRPDVLVVRGADARPARFGRANALVTPPHRAVAFRRSVAAGRVRVLVVVDAWRRAVWHDVWAP